jgi:hypothetical protein
MLKYGLLPADSAWVTDGRFGDSCVMTTETVATDTEGLEPGPTETYAWAEADRPTEAAEELIPRGGNGFWWSRSQSWRRQGR